MRKLFIFIFLGFFTCQSNALTWSNILSLAGENSNEIKSAQKQLEAYRWTYYKSYSGFLPQVSANLSVGESSSSLGNAYNDSYGLNVSQTLFRGLSNYYNLQSATVTVDFYNGNLQSVMANYFNQVRQAFIELYIAQKNLEVQKKIRSARYANVRMIKLLYDGGTEDKGSYLRTKAQLSSADYSVAAAGRQLELARLQLTQLLNTDVTSAEGELKVSPATLPDVDRLTKSSPAYLMAKDQLELADISQKATLSEFLPTVSLNGSYQKSGNSWPPTASGKSLTLNLSLPIFPGGSNFADRAISGFLLDKAREDFAKSEKDFYFSIKQAYEDLTNAIEAYAVQKIVLDASAERARIAQASYMNGLTSYNDWDLIQNDYINNQGSLINSLKNLLVAEAKFSMTYYDDKSYRRWSLRSRGDFDVSVIAEERGGGGHASAAGFLEKIGG